MATSLFQRVSRYSVSQRWIFTRVHTSGYLQIGHNTFEYNTIIKDWQPAKASTQVSHAHLVAFFNINVNRSSLEGLNNHKAPDYNIYDLLAELNALVDNTPTGSLADVLRNQKQNSHPVYVKITPNNQETERVCGSLGCLVVNSMASQGKFITFPL